MEVPCDSFIRSSVPRASINPESQAALSLSDFWLSDHEISNLWKPCGTHHFYYLHILPSLHPHKSTRTTTKHTKKMASVNMFLAPATTISSSTTTSSNTMSSSNMMMSTPSRARRVHTFATAAKGSGKSSEEKGFLDWLAGALEKDGFVETDPILQKVEGKSGGTSTISGKKATAPATPPKKNSGAAEGGFGGFGGLFAKK
ncbi:hypothetical protein QVD17_22742 [Tagetes erecta]|uniref:Uncharacterized protein n=1 Tax=Tagetes erecta TaxID=13708 RepID=A0AAD8NTT2_TARER|nr:hypothetical protein QVD17_22742 [Tagetes erecta]